MTAQHLDWTMIDGDHYEAETDAGSVELYWDDESDPSSSVGWVARLYTGFGSIESEPVGQNVVDEYRAAKDRPDFERWAIIQHLQRQTLDEAKRDAEEYAEANAND